MSCFNLSPTPSPNCFTCGKCTSIPHKERIHHDLWGRKNPASAKAADAATSLAPCPSPLHSAPRGQVGETLHIHPPTICFPARRLTWEAGGIPPTRERQNRLSGSVWTGKSDEKTKNPLLCLVLKLFAIKLPVHGQPSLCKTDHVGAPGFDQQLGTRTSFLGAIRPLKKPGFGNVWATLGVGDA